MVVKITLKEGCTSSRAKSQCHPSVPPPIHDNVMNMVMLFTVFASVLSTGYGRACETEEACGNVNVVERHKGPWRGVGDVEHRVSWRSRGGSEGLDVIRWVQGDKVHVVVPSWVSRSRAFPTASVMVIQRSGATWAAVF